METKLKSETAVVYKGFGTGFCQMVDDWLLELFL